MSGTYEKQDGTTSDDFHIGGPQGPQIDNASGVVEVKNSSGSEYAQVEVSPPKDADANAAVTAAMFNTRLRVVGTFDASTTHNNSATLGYKLCVVQGGSFVYGDLGFDNGLNDGTPLVRVPIATGMVISTTTAVSTHFTLLEHSTYIWDGSTYQLAVPVGTTSGTVAAGDDSRFIVYSTASVSTTPYTASAWQQLEVNTGTGGITVNLPAPASAVNTEVIVSKVSSDDNVVTVATPSGTINGAATLTISFQWSSATLHSTGTNWRIV